MTLATRSKPVEGTKDPDETKDFGFNWALKRLESGETISTSSWAVDSTDITIGTETNSSGITSAFISGGVAGQNYLLKNTITTSAGRTYERSWRIHVVEQ